MHELGSLRHPDDRADPDRHRDQHRPRPDRRGGPQGPDLPRFDRDDPGRRPGRTDPRPRDRRPGEPRLDVRRAGHRSTRDFAAPFAVVAAWIGLWSGIVAQLGLLPQPPELDLGPGRRRGASSCCSCSAASATTGSCRSTPTGRSRSSATPSNASPFFVADGLRHRHRVRRGDHRRSSACSSSAVTSASATWRSPA